MYLFSSSLLEDNTKQDYQRLLEHNIDMVDASLEEICLIGQQISVEPNIMSLYYRTRSEERGSDRYFDYYVASETIRKYPITNELIKSVFIEVNSQDIIVASEGVYQASIYKELQEGALSKFLTEQKQIYKQHEIRGTKADEENKLLIYGQSLPINYTRKVRANLYMVLDMNKLGTYLSPSIAGHGGMVYVVDERDEIIMGFKEGQQPFTALDLEVIDQKDYIITRGKSNHNQWKYISLVPEQTAYIKLRQYSLLTMFLYGFILVFGPGISIYFANRHTKPIKELVSVIEELPRELDNLDDEYRMIHHSLESLIQSNQDLQNRLLVQRPIMEMNFLRGLIEGRFHNQERIQSYMEYINILFKEKYYVVAIIKIQEEEELITRLALDETIIMKAMIYDYLQDHVLMDYYICDAREGELVLIINNDHIQGSKEDENLTTALEGLYSHILEEFRTRLSFGIGGKVDNLMDLHKSYKQAEKAYCYQQYHQRSLFAFYTEIPQHQKGFYYPLEVEIELVNALKSGKSEQLKSVLRRIFDENFVKCQLSLNKRRQLIHLMKGTILREIDEKYMNEEINEVLIKMNNSDNVDEIFNCVIRLHTLMSERIAKNKESKRAGLIKDIKEFMRNHYQESELTLSHVADEFKYSEAYIYQFFKEELGQTYSTYLEQLRLNRACHLLVSSQTSIAQISETVGYNNDTTFRRAFKRVKGVTPSAYKISRTIH